MATCRAHVSAYSASAAGGVSRHPPPPARSGCARCRPLRQRAAPPPWERCWPPSHASASTAAWPHPGSARRGARARRATAGADAATATDEPAPLVKEQLPIGELTVRPLAERDIRGAALLLTRAFAGSPEAVSLEEATEFMSDQLTSPELGVTLVARLVPVDPSLLPKGQPSRLVGTVGLAFDLSEAASRDGLARLRTLPPASAYLSNMAADPKLRRNGVARAMLRGCDAAAAGCSTGVGARSEVWLHVREGDEAARALYAGFGYEEVEREAQQGAGLLGFGFGGAPRRGRVLMRRRVGAPE